jgi:hypothetical protein
MALIDSELPILGEPGSPTGRFAESPLANTKLGDLQVVDIHAGEGVGGMNNLSNIPEPVKIPNEIDGKMVHPAGHHNTEASTTFGTFNPAQLSQNDPFGDI